MRKTRESWEAALRADMEQAGATMETYRVIYAYELRKNEAMRHYLVAFSLRWRDLWLLSEADEPSIHLTRDAIRRIREKPSGTFSIYLGYSWRWQYRLVAVCAPHGEGLYHCEQFEEIQMFRQFCQMWR